MYRLFHFWSSSPLNAYEKQWMIAQVLWAIPSCGKLGSSFCFLALGWSSTGCWSHLGVNQMMENLSVSLPLPLILHYLEFLNNSLKKDWEPMLWYSIQNHNLLCWHPIWVPADIQTSPPSIKLLTNTPGKAAEVHPFGRPWKNLWLLNWAWPIPGHCGFFVE